MPRESKRARLRRMHDEYAILCRVIPEPACALDFDSPFQLLVATVLSAQTTDKRVNTVTPALFAAYPTPAALAAADPQHVEDIIRPIGFYHAKTRNIIALSAQIESRFAGRVPDTMEELVTLPENERSLAVVRIEREITACFPPEEWTDLSHRLILHGRATCHARKPDCGACPLNDTCPSAH